jgi:cytoskeletal protein RodZ
MHPAMKLLWGSVVMVVLAVGALGLVLWRHHAQEVAEENRKQAEIEAKAAEAKAAADVAKARAEEAKAKVALAQEEAKAKAVAAKEAAAGDKKDTAVSKHRGHHGSKAGSKTTVAKAGADDPGKDKKPAPKGGGKKGDDVVDKLLASFK